MILAFFLLPFALRPPHAATATGRAECSTVTSAILKREVKYCALLPPSYDSEKARRYPVLYYLHGLGDNQQTMINSGGWNLIEQLQDEGRVGEFLVITPEGSASFYINSQDGQIRYEDFLLREFFPAMGKKYRLRPGRQARGISGVSMGGYGALRLAFKYPRMFSAVSAHSAALMEDLPERLTTAGPVDRRIEALGRVFGRPLDRDFYNRNSPFTLARQNTLRGLKIYFDCGTSDQYGFYAGAEALHQVLKKRGVAHEFHLYPGGHDWSYLMRHLDASLEFHSRAFGLNPRP